MEEVKDSGEDTSVLYETETAPSAVSVMCELLATVAIVLRRIFLVMESIRFVLRGGLRQRARLRMQKLCCTRVAGRVYRYGRPAALPRPSTPTAHVLSSGTSESDGRAKCIHHSLAGRLT